MSTNIPLKMSHSVIFIVNLYPLVLLNHRSSEYIKVWKKLDSTFILVCQSPK